MKIFHFYSCIDKTNGGRIHTERFLGEMKQFSFGYGIVTIEMFEKKMFQIMCHMMGCNDSSG